MKGGKTSGAKKMRTEQEIRKRLENLEKERKSEGHSPNGKTSLEKQRNKPRSGFSKKRVVY